MFATLTAGQSESEATFRFLKIVVVVVRNDDSPDLQARNSGKIGKQQEHLNGCFGGADCNRFLVYVFSLV